MHVKTYRILWALFMVGIVVPTLFYDMRTVGMDAQSAYYYLQSKFWFFEPLGHVVATIFWFTAKIIPDPLSVFILYSAHIIPYVGFFLLFFFALFVEPPFYRRKLAEQRESDMEDDGPSASEILDRAKLDFERREYGE